MRFHLVLAFVLGLVAQPLLARQADAAASSSYESLVAGLKASVDSQVTNTVYLNFWAIRNAYAESPSYDPYGTLVELQRVEMLRAYQHGDLKVALEEADKVLDQNYTDVGAHVIEDLVYADAGDQVHARFHRMLAREFLLSIMRTGDGNSPASAYQIIAVPEEYAVLNARQIQFQSQSYQTIGGQYFDKVMGFDARTNKSVAIYFNVDRLMDWADRMFSPQFRRLQPHGGPPDSAVASATAMMSSQQPAASTAPPPPAPSSPDVPPPSP